MNAERLKIALQVNEQYRHMKEDPDRHPEVVAKARAAIQACGIEVRTRSIRRGTEGTRLIFMGYRRPICLPGGCSSTAARNGSR